MPDPSEETPADRIGRVLATNPVARGSMTFLAGAAGVLVGSLVGPEAAVASGAANIAGVTWLQQRLAAKGQNLVAQTEARLQALEEQGKLDQDARASQDYLDVALETIIAATTAEDEKIGLYSRLLAGSVSTDRPEHLSVRALLSTLIGLTASEISLARVVKAEFERSSSGSIQLEIARPNWGPDTDFHLNRLQAAGLLETESAPPPIRAAGTFHLRPTATLDRLVDLLSAGDPIFGPEVPEGR